MSWATRRAPHSAPQVGCTRPSGRLDRLVEQQRRLHRDREVRRTLDRERRTTGPLGRPRPPCLQDEGQRLLPELQNGAISWTAATGAWETYGVIRDRWKALGFENGALGYPVGVPTCGTKDNGCFQNFQMGAISWTAATGAWETYGDIRIRWAALGFETGVLSYPPQHPSAMPLPAAATRTIKVAPSPLDQDHRRLGDPCHDIRTL